MNLSEQKYHLIQLISVIDNPGLLAWMERELRLWQGETATINTGKRLPDKASELRRKLDRPIRKRLEPETLKKAQDWTGHDELALMRDIRELNVEEPIEELLASIV